jgi:hypothetical protein
MVREQREHLLSNLVDLLVGVADLHTEVMDTVDIQPFVHELLPEVEAVVGRVDYLFLEGDEELLEVVDLHDVDGLLVGEQHLVLPVHDVLHGLLALV